MIGSAIFKAHVLKAIVQPLSFWLQCDRSLKQSDISKVVADQFCIGNIVEDNQI